MVSLPRPRPPEAGRGGGGGEGRGRVVAGIEDGCSRYAAYRRRGSHSLGGPGRKTQSSGTVCSLTHTLCLSSGNEERKGGGGRGNARWRSEKPQASMLLEHASGVASFFPPGFAENAGRPTHRSFLLRVRWLCVRATHCSPASAAICFFCRSCFRWPFFCRVFVFALIRRLEEKKRVALSEKTVCVTYSSLLRAHPRRVRSH